MLKRWEYRTATFYLGNGEIYSVHPNPTLQALGAKGWELVTVFGEAYDGELIALLKRPAQLNVEFNCQPIWGEK